VPESPRPVADLLAAAIEHLEPADRQRVTAWFLGRLSGQPLPPGWPSSDPADFPKVVRALAPESSGDFPSILSRYGVATGDHQVVPVRLPTELHARLRDWSQANGFSMATIIRGLVTRFLDEQDRAAS